MPMNKKPKAKQQVARDTPNLGDVIQRLTKAVNEAKEQEIQLNRQLGYEDDRHKGSLVVLARWEDLDTLLKSVQVPIQPDPYLGNTVPAYIIGELA
jgi:hypothetical protein